MLSVRSLFLYRFVFQVLSLLAVVVLQGCGGGGGSSSFSDVPNPTLTSQASKTFHFSWPDVTGEIEYRLLEDPDSASGYSQVATIAADATSYDLEVFLPGRINARYILQACNSEVCNDSTPVVVSDTLSDAIGYVKASNTGANDLFGFSVALSSDGNTLAIGAMGESSSTSGINTTPDDNATQAGAVYIFSRNGASWNQQAYIKASNSAANDLFGSSVALSNDGNTLAVGANLEDSSTAGINTSPDEAATDAGAAYVFTRSGTAWTQQAYIKASNPGAGDNFGLPVSLSSDGNTLAVGAFFEDSGTSGINTTSDEAATDAGAAYVFTRSGASWTEQAYIKPSNTGAGDTFGRPLVINGDGNTLAVAARLEDSSTSGINSTPNDLYTNSDVGAVYVFTLSGAAWSEQAYIKASNAGMGDMFGQSVAFSSDGNTLAVGASNESSGTAGINSTPDEAASGAGAAYVYSRSGSTWSEQAYIKASNTETLDTYGISVALSGDGNTLAVGASGEDSASTGINSTPDEAASGAGAAYLYLRSASSWSEQAYIKASNTGSDDDFGISLVLSGDGQTLVIGAYREDSGSSGVNSTSNEAATDAGAVYLY